MYCYTSVRKVLQTDRYDVSKISMFSILIKCSRNYSIKLVIKLIIVGLLHEIKLVVYKMMKRFLFVKERRKEYFEKIQLCIEEIVFMRYYLKKRTVSSFLVCYSYILLILAWLFKLHVNFRCERTVWFLKFNIYNIFITFS